MNLALLVKIMGKTQSDNDAEALAFMRRANTMVKAAGLTWEQLLSGQVRTLAPSSDDSVEVAKPRPPMEAQISYALGYLEPLRMAKSLREFLDDCKRRFESDNYLNENARATLFGMVRKAKAGGSLL